MPTIRIAGRNILQKRKTSRPRAEPVFDPDAEVGLSPLGRTQEIGHCHGQPKLTFCTLSTRIARDLGTLPRRAAILVARRLLTEPQAPSVQSECQTKRVLRSYAERSLFRCAGANEIPAGRTVVFPSRPSYRAIDVFRKTAACAVFYCASETPRGMPGSCLRPDTHNRNLKNRNINNGVIVTA